MSLFHRLKTLWHTLRGNTYSWPAQDISLPGGREFHLVGSIHMGTQDMSPLPPKLLQKIARADALIVEANIASSDTPFRDMPEFPPLEERLSELQLAALDKQARELGLSLTLFSTQPLWQIAMVLQATQAQQLGLRPDYGIDLQLIQAAQARQIPVVELEGAERQIALLCELPDNGMALLDDTLEHWHTNARLLQMMISWWLEHPPAAQDVKLPNTFSEGLYDVLMHKRNRAWRDFLCELPAGHYVVAVGALHLYGEGNLADIMK